MPITDGEAKDFAANDIEAALPAALLGGALGMTTTTPCDKHLFEEATGMCRECRRPFCAECLVYAQGPRKAPYCIPCALTAAGVRSAAGVKAQRATKGMTGRLLSSLAATALATAVVIPALSILH